MAKTPKDPNAVMLTPQRRHRVALIQERLGLLVPEFQIIKECTTLWNIPEKEVKALIKIAFDRLARNNAGVADEERRAQLLLGAQQGFLKAYALDRPGDMIKATEFIAKLCGLTKNQVQVGLDPATAGALGVGVGLGSTLGLKSPADVRARIEELKQKLLPPLSPTPTVLKQDDEGDDDEEAVSIEEAPGGLGAGSDDPEGQE